MDSPNTHARSAVQPKSKSKRSKSRAWSPTVNDARQLDLIDWISLATAAEPVLRKLGVPK